MKKLNNFIKLAWWLIAVSAVLLAIGCGGSSGGGSGDSGPQTYTGKFVNNSGAPLAGIPVRVASTGDQAVTDITGTASILTSTGLSGDVQIQAGNPEVTLTLFSISSSTDTIVFNVTFDQNARRASVTSLTTLPLQSNTIAMVSNCQDCHTIMGDPNCADRNWRNTHADVFECNTGIGGPASASDNCTFCHGDRGAPQCDNPTWKAIHVTYPCTGTTGTQNTGSWDCLSCHQDRGHAQCGNPGFEADHPFVSCQPGTGDESTLRCDSCHALEKQPQCDNPQWLQDHPWWTCGPRTGTCTTCHEYKGSPDCNRAYWKEVHDFYSCAEGLDCAQCHADEIDTQCNDSSWRSIHNFVGTGINTGDTNNLCSSCHDNDRGGIQCNDATWTAFHCFCG